MCLYQSKTSPMCGLVICVSTLALLMGCAVDSSRPGDAAISCDQMIAEIGQQDAAAQAAERHASEVRPGVYAYKALTYVPFIGGIADMVDQMSNVSHSRELDRFTDEARDAQHRRDYLKGIQPARCRGSPTTAGVPPAPEGEAGTRSPG